MTPHTEAFLKDFNRGSRTMHDSDGTPIFNRTQTEAATNVLLAIAAVDRVFADRRISDTVDFCDHCTSAEYVDYLRTTPREKLSEEEIFGLVSDLTNTFGDEVECTWIAPRLLRDAIGVPMYDIDLAMGRLRKARTIWSREEIDAVTSFLEAQWDFVLQTTPLPDDNSLSHTVTFLSTSAQLGFLESALAVLRERKDDTSDARFLEMFEDAYLFDSYGTIRPEDYDVIQAWLRSPDISRRAAFLFDRVATQSEERANALRNAFRKLSRQPDNLGVSRN